MAEGERDADLEPVIALGFRRCAGRRACAGRRCADDYGQGYRSPRSLPALWAMVGPGA
ncbi:protein of unassigned function [Methylobacterium oryzae CBMB20]|uniref:Protein of unassigned function n=1 Tax=Methylobacterium oryzae CBMB20 TaxID=693986 RepID=A0A089NTW5_9HYPH|nr:protein of unassigned function [Methylobacterium oryzae CBMB20]